MEIKTEEQQIKSKIDHINEENDFELLFVSMNEIVVFYKSEYQWEWEDERKKNSDLDYIIDEARDLFKVQFSDYEEEDFDVEYDCFRMKFIRSPK